MRAAAACRTLFRLCRHLLHAATMSIDAACLLLLRRRLRRRLRLIAACFLPPAMPFAAC